MRNIILVLLCISFSFSSCVSIYNSTSVLSRHTNERFGNYDIVNKKLSLEILDNQINMSLSGYESKRRYDQDIRKMQSKQARWFTDLLDEAPPAAWAVLWAAVIPIMAIDIVNPFPVLGFKKREYVRKSKWTEREKIIDNNKTGISSKSIHISSTSENVIINNTNVETNSLGIATTQFKVDNSFISQNNSLYNEKSFETINPEFFNIQAQISNLKASTNIGPYKNIGLYINQLASTIESKMNEKYFCRADFLVRDESNKKPLSGAQVKIKLPSLKLQNEKLKTCLKKEINKVVAKESTWLKQELFKKMYQRINHQITKNNEIKVARNGHFKLKVFKDVYNMVFVENNSFAKEKFDCTKSKIQYKILFSSTHSRLTIEQISI